MSENRGNKSRIVTWVTRVCFAIVFAWNIECALSFVISPEAFTSGFQVQSVPGIAAVRGLGTAFLMWNATYPLFIINPQKYKALGGVIIAQQIIGLVGELYILLTLPGEGYALLAGSITRFVAFDATGLVMMLVSFAVLIHVSHRE